ncbi:MAG: protein-L-isoaspartate(D-aspartate) O-methyltransferase [Bacteroidota bacterium]
MQESDKYIAQRESLVYNLKFKGITDPYVLDALLKVPRQYFMSPEFRKFSYSDDAFPIEEGQTISQPFTVAYQTQLLNIQPGDKVLEIGTGSGYQAAVLIAMKARVFTLERIEKLHVNAKSVLEKLDMLPEYMSFDDGCEGLAEYAPFDKIIVTAATAVLPVALKEQLKIGGLIVAPIGVNVQDMTVYEKLSLREFSIRRYDQFRFVPLKKDKKPL